ncbi:feather keratin-like [Apus apus]|uniref:feather keratin-like n=1 Tax=Apus apus TaxID=8895 RepID=UPI0021F88169|nr:feather keratin-like [Apus apus]
MACYDRCGSCGPTPLANSCNEPCVRQCETSRVVIQPPAVLVTLPGPILTSFPQSTAVGSSASAAVGNEAQRPGSARQRPGASAAFGRVGSTAWVAWAASGAEEAATPAKGPHHHS